MYTKPLSPTIQTAMAKKFDLFTYLYEVRKTIRENLEADARSPINHQEFYPSLIGDLLDEVCTAIDLVEQQVEIDPTDYICDGEPPMTMAELHSVAWKEHLEAHS
jgi:hypothetical protein